MDQTSSYLTEYQGIKLLNQVSYPGYPITAKVIWAAGGGMIYYRVCNGRVERISEEDASPPQSRTELASQADVNFYLDGSLAFTANPTIGSCGVGCEIEFVLPPDVSLGKHDLTITYHDPMSHDYRQTFEILVIARTPSLSKSNAPLLPTW